MGLPTRKILLEEGKPAILAFHNVSLSTGKKMGYKELAEGWLAKKEKESSVLLTTANDVVNIAPTTVEQLNEAIEIEMQKLRIKKTK